MVKNVGHLGSENITLVKNMTRELFAAAFNNSTAWDSLEDPSSIPFIILPEDKTVKHGFSSQTFSHFLECYGLDVLKRTLFIWNNVQRYPRPSLWYPQLGVPNITANLATLKVRKVRRLRLHIAVPKATPTVLETAKINLIPLTECSTKSAISILGPSTRMMPSVIHMIALALRAQDAREQLFNSIGFEDTSVLTPALAASLASGSLNYERLDFWETLT